MPKLVSKEMKNINFLGSLVLNQCRGMRVIENRLSNVSFNTKRAELYIDVIITATFLGILVKSIDMTVVTSND